jgi:hypothetical protein
MAVPYELILAGFGAYTSIELHMCADRITDEFPVRRTLRGESDMQRYLP